MSVLSFAVTRTDFQRVHTLMHSQTMTRREIAQRVRIYRYRFLGKVLSCMAEAGIIEWNQKKGSGSTWKPLPWDESKVNNYFSSKRFTKATG